MTMPVINWNGEVGGQRYFFDARSSSVRHYAPRLKWSDLTRNDLGGRRVLFHGVLDLSLSEAELRALSHELGGVRLTPVPLVDTENKINLSIAADPDHTVKITLLNNVPFPSVAFSATVNLDKPTGAGLDAEIVRRWNERTIFSGTLSLGFAGVEAEGGYTATLDYKRFAELCLQHTAGRGLPKSEAFGVTRRVVEDQAASWLSYYGGAEVPSAREAAKFTLGEALQNAVFYERGDIVKYDNGMRASEWGVREPSSLNVAEARILIKTRQQQGRATFTF